MKTLEDIRQYLVQFAQERDWEQFQYPKNIAMALSVEAAELLEPFQWLTERESDNLSSIELQAIKNEIADVQMYLILLANRLNIDIIEAVQTKSTQNELKYPVEQVKGKSKKYTQYQNSDRPSPSKKKS